MAIGKVLDPTAVRADDITSPGPDVGPMVGKTVGFRLDEIWRAWDWVAEIWAEEFRKAGATVKFWRSNQGRTGAEGDRIAKALDEFLNSIDIAVVGLGNCGSCTGWTIHDALAAAARGLPTTAICTEVFEELGRNLAERGGRSGLRIHVLPYPLNEKLKEEVNVVAYEHLHSVLQTMGATMTALREAAVSPRRSSPAVNSTTERKKANLRDCGPAGCDLDWLSSERHEAEVDDVMAFTQFSLEHGWGDGLPLIPPTESRVRKFLSQNNRYADEVICKLPPTNANCTVEKIAINAVMAGAPAASLPLIIASLEALANPDFELFGVNATTAPVVPLTLVNGPIRNKLDIPYKHGCLGGAPSTAVAIGRAIRLIIKNIAGQRNRRYIANHIRHTRPRGRHYCSANGKSVHRGRHLPNVVASRAMRYRCTAPWAQ